MDNSSKIQKVSSILQYLSYVTAGLIIILALLFSVFLGDIPANLVPLLNANPAALRIREAALLVALPAWLIYLSPSFLLAYGVWRLGCMFSLLKVGTYFSDEAVSHLLVFTLCGFVGQFFAPIFGAIAGFVVSPRTATPNFDIYLNIDGLEVVQLMTWATFMTVAWILREGIRLTKENEEFI